MRNEGEQVGSSKDIKAALNLNVDYANEGVFQNRNRLRVLLSNQFLFYFSLANLFCAQHIRDCTPLGCSRFDNVNDFY